MPGSRSGALNHRGCAATTDSGRLPQFHMALSGPQFSARWGVAGGVHGSGVAMVPGQRGREEAARRDASAAAAAAAAARRQQRTLLELWHIKQQISLPALVAQAARYAVSDFWGRLASFAALGQAPRSWLAQVGASHPFLSMGGRHVNLGAPHNCSMGGGNGGVLQARNVAEALETALHVQTEQQHAVGSPAADQARPVILGAQEGQCRRHGQRLTAMWEAVGVKVPSSQGATCTLVCTHRVAPRARQCSLYDLCPGVCMRPIEIDAQSSAAIP